MGFFISTLKGPAYSPGFYKKKTGPGKMYPGEQTGGSPRGHSLRTAGHSSFADRLPHLAGPSSNSVEGALGEWPRIGTHRHGGAIKRRGGQSGEGQRGGKQRHGGDDRHGGSALTCPS